MKNLAKLGVTLATILMLATSCGTNKKEKETNMNNNVKEQTY